MELNEFLDRFVLEPRCKFRAGGGTSGCWLVVYDKLTQSYMKDPGSKSYAKFDNSTEAFLEIINRLLQEEIRA